MRRRDDPSDRTTAEGKVLEPWIPKPKAGGRPPTTERREVLHAIVARDRTGCPWRALPHDVPPWSTVWSALRTWRTAGTWQPMHPALREQGRVSRGREPTPSAAIIDRPSVNTSHTGGFAALTAADPSPGARDRSLSIPRV